MQASPIFQSASHRTLGLSPVTIIAGLFVVPINGFLIGVGITSSLFLQTPEKVGGYGFSPLQNAACQFFVWMCFSSKVSAKRYPSQYFLVVRSHCHAIMWILPQRPHTLAHRTPPAAEASGIQSFDFTTSSLSLLHRQ